MPNFSTSSQNLTHSVKIKLLGLGLKALASHGLIGGFHRTVRVGFIDGPKAPCGASAAACCSRGHLMCTGTVIGLQLYKKEVSMHMMWSNASVEP